MSRIITIAREFGSGGRELGRRLAEELGYEYYDHEVITEIAKKTDLAEEYVTQVLHNKPHNLYPITIGQSMSYVGNYTFQQVQSVYKAQHDIIRELAAKSPCVIVGRCADYILQDMEPFRIFVYADMEKRIQRCINRAKPGEDTNPKHVKKTIKRIDKERGRYYEFYTGLEWGDPRNYDLCVNAGEVEMKKFAPLLAKMFKD